MPLAPGTRLGPYQILSALGAGGMGEVYRARDTKLNRDVALKVIPDTFALDPDRVSRFQREAQVLATLNHPHIAAIYGFEDSGKTHALVLELVEGETLADRIARGPLPLDEALPIARQICEALEAAHEPGIIHRDLKPANIKITPDGVVKVLDFGLAKLTDPAQARPSDLSGSPTITSPAMMTGVGVILGTAAYMSPEQAKGRPADKRSDLWAFGCVLYEMLTGTRPFGGEDVTDVMVAVLSKEPDWSALPAVMPTPITRLLHRSLEKDRKRRLDSAAAARLEIDEPFDEGTTRPAAPVVPPRPFWRRALPILLTAAVVGVITAMGVWSLRPSTPGAPITRFPLTLPEGPQFASTGRQVIAMSPDGSKVAYIANQRLYLRSMGELQTRPIPGSESLGFSSALAFSPDGQSIAFNSITSGVRQLMRIAVNGGAAVAVCTIDGVYDMSWGSDGIVLGQGNKGILLVSANGAKKTVVSVKEGELAHGPQILPGGEFVLFTLAKGTATDRWDRAQIVVESMKSGQRKTLIDGGSDARYVSTGHIVYAVGGVLFAAPFDVRRLELTGLPVPVVEGVMRSSGNALSGTVTGTAYFNFSRTGTLIYIPGPVASTSPQSNLVLIDRKGIREQLKIPPGPYLAPRLSPDGKRIVVGTDDGKEAIVWIYELSGTSTIRKLAFDGRNRFPIWSADGQHVAFQSTRDGDLGIWWQAFDGKSPAVRLTKADEGTSHVPESWSRQIEGDLLLVSIVKAAGNALWTLSMPDKKLAPFGDVRSRIPTDAVFSPDRRWVAYQTGIPTAHSLYVEPFPRTGTRYPISNGNAHHPLWSPDGKELFYVPERGEPVVVTVATEPSFSVGDPIQLPTSGVEAGAGFSRNYDVTPDGTRLLRVIDAGQTQSGTPSAPQIQVVLNWFTELQQRVPTR